MPLIRVGFIGLSKSGWAASAHLPYLKNSEKYQIVAICNSSVESARDAIKLYGLPAETKAYADPEDVANDPNIDLVVCSVRVDRHFATISPSLKAGKDVFVENPLGKNLAEARELLRLKDEGKVKSAVVGLQARKAPIIQTVKSLINEGKIGKLLSSTWLGHAIHGGPSTSEDIEYLGQRDIGGNLVTIHFGHAIDYIQFVLGYGFTAPPKSLLANQRKHQVLLSTSGEVLQESYPKTSDDTIFLHGTLSSGIPLSLSLRGGKPFKGEPGLDWRICGDKGEIRITASGPFLQIGYPDMRVQLQEGEGEATDVELPRDGFDEYGVPARNVGRLYEGLAEGEVNCSFEEAVQWHELIDGMYKENGIDV